MVEEQCTEPETAERANWMVQGRQNHPLNYATWTQASAFCAWVGGRLPSEAEWEFAARNRGQDVTYPWGESEPTCDEAVIAQSEDSGWGCGEGHSLQVCSRPAGNTEQGLCDMSGNVIEWVADEWHENYTGAPGDGSAWIESSETTVRVIRGGSYRYVSDTGILTTTGRSHYSSDLGEPDLGFRCVREPQ